MPGKRSTADCSSNGESGEIIPIYKPRGITSFAVVRQIRQSMNAKKVGHAGTLDPLAEGLLIVLTGKKTKLMNDFLKFDKEYSATFRLGMTSKSFDLETEVIEQAAVPDLTVSRIEEVLRKYTGKFEQLPPEFSAAWVGGKRAYHLARRGLEVKLKPKSVSISRLDIQSFVPPTLEVSVVCSSGTYIRSLARDIGQDLGCGAVLTRLVRTRIGPYTLANANRFDDVSSLPDQSNMVHSQGSGLETYAA